MSGRIESLERIEGGATNNLGVADAGASKILWDGASVTVAAEDRSVEASLVTAVGGSDVLAALRADESEALDDSNGLVGACAVVLVDGASSDPLSVGRPILLAVGPDVTGEPIAIHPELSGVVEQRSTLDQVAADARSETALS